MRRSRSTAEAGEPPRAFARYLGRDEEVLLITRQHPFALLGRAAQAGGLLVPLLLAAWGIAGVEFLRGPVGDWILRIEFLIMGAIVLRLAWDVVCWEFERVIVSDEKVIHVQGVLQRRIASTPHAKVSEFTVLQPWLGRIFNYGSLVVDVPGGREQALHGLNYLPDPTSVYRLVSDTARTERIREGGGEPEQPRQLGPVQWMDPWADERLQGDQADHTLRIPRAPGL